MTKAITIPEGYRRNANGHLVPESKIKEWDLVRDDLVNSIAIKALEVQLQMQNFKIAIEGDIEAFMNLSAEQYGVTLGGKKGNTTLTSFDGALQVKVQVHDRIVFDERLQVAKALVDKCIHAWAVDSNDNIKALVEHAFQTDKAGKINISRVLGLLQLNIDDDNWMRAMDAIRDSMQVASSKSYIRIYQRIDDTDQYKQILLDMASL